MSVNDDECQGSAALGAMYEAAREQWRRTRNYPDFIDDDLREIQVFDLLDAEWTPEGAARDEAAAEQIEAAMREAESHDDRQRYPVLKWVPDVREKLQEVMTTYHRIVPAADFGHLEQVVEVFSGPGVPLPFNRDDPSQQTGLFGLVAGREHRLHVLRGEYTVERWLCEERQHASECQWSGPKCASYTRDMLMFARGQFLVAVPTCFACAEHLLRGGSRNKPVARYA